MKSFAIIPVTVLLAIAIVGCQIKEQKDDKGNKNVTINTGLGSLRVKESGVDPAATGLSVYPNASPKANSEHDKGTADVNIESAWGGLKVVAASYTSDDAPEKVWDYYKKEITSRYGKPLECRPGSPDLKKNKEHGDDLTCWEKGDKDHNRGIKIDAAEADWQLKIGSDSRQRIVAIKPKGNGTEFALVYLVTHGEKEGM